MQLGSLVCVLLLAAFWQQWQSWIFVTETIWPTKSQIFTLWLFTGKVWGLPALSIHLTFKFPLHIYPPRNYFPQEPGFIFAEHFKSIWLFTFAWIKNMDNNLKNMRKHREQQSNQLWSRQAELWTASVLVLVQGFSQPRKARPINSGHQRSLSLL